MSIVLSVILLLLFLFLYVWFIKPLRAIKGYVKAFESAGFRVKTFPYRPLSFVAYNQYVDNYNQKGDCLYAYKHDLQNYDVLIANAGTSPSIHLHLPKLTKQFCNHEREFYYRKFQARILFMEKVTGRGLVTSEGQQWKRKRLMLSKVFNFNLISQMVEKIRHKCHQAFEKFEGHKNYHIIKVCDLTADISSNVIFEGFIGGNIEKQTINGEPVTKYFIRLIEDTNNQIMDPFIWICGPSFLELGLRKIDRDIKQRTKIFNNWAISYMKERIACQKQKMKLEKSSYIPKDIISSVFVEKAKEKRNDNGFNDVEILNELRTFFIAGTDTTSHLTEAALYHILKNPEIQNNLRDEINQYVRVKQYSYDDIKQMKYMESVLKEAVRMNGPGNEIFVREAVKDHEVCGIRIFKDTVINYSGHWVHFSPQHYRKPLQFRPDRWLNGQCQNLDPYAFIGFHSGSRSCIGKNLALLESKIMLIQIFKRYSELSITNNKQYGTELNFLFQMQSYTIKAKRSNDSS